VNKIGWFTRKDASNGLILLLLQVILALCIQFSDHAGGSSVPAKKEDLIVKYSLIQLKRHCYDLPYSHDQMEEIWEKGGKKKRKLQQILQKETMGEDLSKVASLPIIFYSKDKTTLCLDFHYSINVEQPQTKNRSL
jgi:hypothetical protein